MDDKILERLDQKKDKQRIKTKRKKEERMATGGVFDKYTTEQINKLKVKGIIKEFVGIISAGKEANVYFAIGEGDRPLAVKIYKIDPQNTKWMKNYIIGDPRFKKIGNSTHKIIYTWSKKEFKNLKQLYRKNIPVPEPLYCVNNIVVMEYIGDDNGTPAPKLKDLNPIPDPKLIFFQIIQSIEEMYLEANLVHGDLSEFNILYWEEKPVIIDVSQAVSTYHVNAPVFLKRDIINTFNFFGNFLDETTLGTVDEVFARIMKAYHNR